MLLERDNDTTFNFKFTNCLIRFNDPNNNFTGSQYDFDDITQYENILFNDDPEFLDPQNNKLQIPNGSPADGQAIMFGMLSSDILNMLRGNPSDLGAYESTEFVDED